MTAETIAHYHHPALLDLRKVNIRQQGSAKMIDFYQL